MAEQKEKKKNKLVWVIILLLLLLIGVGGGIYYQITKESELDRLARDEMALGGLLPGKSDDEITDIISEKVAEGMVDIEILSGPVFEYGGKKGRIGVANSESNRYSFQVTIRLDDTGESIYESGLIDPGFYVEYIELSKTLQPGDYPATATFTTYSLDESEDAISQLNVQITLHVMEGLYYR